MPCKKQICSICKKEIEKKYNDKGVMYWDKGNNAYPINEGRCCDKCNKLVILERIKRLYK